MEKLIGNLLGGMQVMTFSLIFLSHQNVARIQWHTEGPQKPAGQTYIAIFSIHLYAFSCFEWQLHSMFSMLVERQTTMGFCRFFGSPENGYLEELGGP